MTEIFIALHLPVSARCLPWHPGERFQWEVPWDVEDRLWIWIEEYDQVNCMFLEPCGAFSCWARVLNTNDPEPTMRLEMIVNHSDVADFTPHVLRGGLPLNRLIPVTEGRRLQDSFIHHNAWEVCGL